MKRRCKWCFKYGLDQHRDGHLMDDMGNPTKGDPRGLATDGICLRAYPLIEKECNAAILAAKKEAK